MDLIPTHKYEGNVYQIESTIFGCRNIKSKRVYERPRISGNLISLTNKPLSELSVLTSDGKYVRVKVITESLKQIVPSTISEIDTGQTIEAVWNFKLKDGSYVTTWWSAEIVKITPFGNKDVSIKYSDNSFVELYLHEIR